MSYKKIDEEDLGYFRQILGEKRVSIDPELLSDNSRDHTEDLHFLPEVILYPTSSQEVSQILSYCNEKLIPVTPRGAGTGLSGGSLPIFGGVSLDFKKMNHILNVDEENFQVTTEPGIITEELQNLLQAKGLFYPVDPASRGSCFIGGNIAENSGGPRAVKYGTVKDYVLNLEVVLADGTIMQTGADTLKNATGFDLTRLVVGSEGTLAVVTKITLRLLAFPTQRILMLAPFLSPKTACVAVNKILLAGFQPSALEFMERDALNCAQNYIGDFDLEIGDKIKAHLLIELDGNDKEDLFQQAGKIGDLLGELTEEEILFADSKQEQDKLWRLRRIVGEATKKSSIYKEEDTVVPRAYIPDLLEFVKQVGGQYGFKSICYGHTGDGNLHVNILKDNLTDQEWEQKVPLGIREIFAFVKEKGGTISGEHGIGYVQKNYLPIVFSKETLKLMKGIKKVFDPKGILNPGKVLPDSIS